MPRDPLTISALTPDPSPLAPRRSRGFTMIELLVVIAIIAIISGILVVGLKSVAAHQQRNQTLVMLKRLDNAIGELTTSTPGAFKMYTIQLPSIYFPPSDANSPDYRTTAYSTWIGVPAGALESQVRTALVLKQVVSSNPAAKKFLDDLPPERKKLIYWNFTNATLPGSAALLPPATSGRTKPEYVMPLDAWGNPILFVFDGLQTPTGTNVGRPMTQTVAGKEEYVGGLTYLFSDSEKSYYKPTTDFAPAPVYPDSMTTNTDSPNASENLSFTAHVALYSTLTPPLTHAARMMLSDPTKPEQTLRSPDHKPFWMSAGPDGKYDTTDDNVYSFGE